MSHLCRSGPRGDGEEASGPHHKSPGCALQPSAVCRAEVGLCASCVILRPDSGNRVLGGTLQPCCGLQDAMSLHDLDS